MSAPLFADRIQCLYVSFGSGAAVCTAVSQLLERLRLAGSPAMARCIAPESPLYSANYNITGRYQNFQTHVTAAFVSNCSFTDACDCRSGFGSRDDGSQFST